MTAALEDLPDENLFNQGILWIAEEQKFMLVGGRNERREIQVNARLHSPYFPETPESLQPAKLKRDGCSICLLQSDIAVAPLKD